jgi:hypothetical protein
MDVPFKQKKWNGFFKVRGVVVLSMGGSQTERELKAEISWWPLFDTSTDSHLTSSNLINTNYTIHTGVFFFLI